MLADYWGRDICSNTPRHSHIFKYGSNFLTQKSKEALRLSDILL